MKLKILLIPLLFISGYMNAQNLSDHVWKNRVLIVSNDDIKNQSIFKKQLTTIKQDLGELKERKLIVYSISEEAYQKDFQEQKYPITDNQKNRFQLDNKPFKIILIGLDGGVKYESEEFLSLKKLFAMIDGMPMHRAEMKN